MLVRVLLLAAVSSLAFAELAGAHGLVGRRDLPVPTWLFAWAATTVLVVSFVGLGALWRTPRLSRARERRMFSLPRWLEIPVGALGVALLGAVLAAGFFGVQIDTANLAPTAIFVGLWLAVPFASLLLGDIYAALNPVRAIGRACGWVAGKVTGDGLPAPLQLPERLGRWPAAALLLGYGWVELAFPGRTDPSQLAAVVAAFVVLQGVGMSLFGTEQWVSRADPFAVWFSWVATLSPLRWDDGTLYLRAPGVGNAKRPAVAGDAAVVFVAIGTTMWDGLSGGDLLATARADLADSLSQGALSLTWANALVSTAGMLISVAIAAAIVVAGVWRMPAGRALDLERRHREPTTHAALLRDFAPSLVPIGVAYAVGHYVSLLAFQGQALPQLLSNPLGRQLAPGEGGWLGAGDWTIDYGWISAATIWYLQVAALLAGHVLALVLSHDRALERFPHPWAGRSQRSMLVVAVAFTCAGLWLLSSV